MLISLRNISKNYGIKNILSDVSQNINEHEHIGLIGANGSGKTTLMKIIAGIIEPDGGSITYKSELSVGYLQQDLGLEENCSIIEEAFKASFKLIEAENELEKLRKKIEKTQDITLLNKLNHEYHTKLERFEENKGYYYRNITIATLKGLGYDETDHQKLIKNLSGGQKMRVALAKMLIAAPELLLLDEPTNYLDLKSISWLENYLSQYPGAYIVVSHDRYFLEKTVNIIWEADDGSITRYQGNYSAYLYQREENERAYQKAYHNQQKYIKHQQEVIDKLKSFNREKSIKRAESREKQLSKIERLEKISAKKSSRISFETGHVITKKALILRNLSVGYDGKELIGGIDIEIKTGEKIGICGDNAAGKSTILKTLTGEITPISGDVEFGSGVTATYFKQQHEDLNPENTILEELAQYSGEDNLTIRNVLGSLLFSADDVYKKIEVLSGGEESRVAVAKLMLTKSNMLLLDEPTNHLDITSKEVFETALREYEGTVLVVSHDRYLLGTIADRMMFIDNGKCTVYNCGYEKANELFSIQMGSHQTTDSVQDISKTQKAKPEAISKNMLKRSRDRILEIEQQMPLIEQQKQAIEAEINSENFYKDLDTAESKLKIFDELTHEYHSLEEEWIELNYLLD